MSPSDAPGHETRDMDGRVMAWLVLGMGMTVGAVVAGMILLLTLMSREREASLPRFPAEQTAQPAPPAPRPQAAPAADLAHLRAREDALLSHYAWIGDDHRRARIPLSRAMQLTVGATLGPPP